MSGGYLEFFVKPAVADMYQSIRKDLDKLIHSKVGANWFHSSANFTLIFESCNCKRKKKTLKVEEKVIFKIIP